MHDFFPSFVFFFFGKTAQNGRTRIVFLWKKGRKWNVWDFYAVGGGGGRNSLLQ